MSGEDVTAAFGAASARPRVQTAPTSIRFSAAERAWLLKAAGAQSLSGYIRRQVLPPSLGGIAQATGGTVPPPEDPATLAKALSVLGASQIAVNLQRIARAADDHRLVMDDTLRGDLAAACADVRAMRAALLCALGIHDQHRLPRRGPGA